MARMWWLPTVLRDAGLTVIEHPGWATRGKDGYDPKTKIDSSMRPRIVIAHHTGSHPASADSTITNLLVNGRPPTDPKPLPGPLCHLGLNRWGTFIVIAAGKANHAGLGHWQDANESVEAIGIEGYNWGNGVPFPTREPWSRVQLDAYAEGVAALLKHIGRDERFVCAHREWATPPGRKPDPSGIDMDDFRQKVGYLIRKDEMTLTQARLELATAWHTKSGQWMTPQPPESAQGRLTRLSLELYRGERTVGEIVAFAPAKTSPPDPGERIPAWVVDGSVPSPA